MPDLMKLPLTKHTINVLLYNMTKVEERRNPSGDSDYFAVNPHDCIVGDQYTCDEVMKISMHYVDWSPY